MGGKGDGNRGRGKERTRKGQGGESAGLPRAVSSPVPTARTAPPALCLPYPHPARLRSLFFHVLRISKGVRLMFFWGWGRLLAARRGWLGQGRRAVGADNSSRSGPAHARGDGPSAYTLASDLMRGLPLGAQALGWGFGGELEGGGMMRSRGRFTACRQHAQFTCGRRRSRSRRRPR